MLNVKKQIKSFLLENFLFTDDEMAIGDDESFLGSGFIDSTGMMEIILWLEDTFGIEVENDEMIPANLDSVNSLIGFVDRKTGSK